MLSMLRVMKRHPRRVEDHELQAVALLVRQRLFRPAFVHPGCG
jgi:hypothetical protein